MWADWKGRDLYEQSHPTAWNLGNFNQVSQLLIKSCSFLIPSQHRCMVAASYHLMSYLYAQCLHGPHLITSTVRQMGWEDEDRLDKMQGGK